MRETVSGPLPRIGLNPLDEVCEIGTIAPWRPLRSPSSDRGVGALLPAGVPEVARRDIEAIAAGVVIWQRHASPAECKYSLELSKARVPLRSVWCVDLVEQSNERAGLRNCLRIGAVNSNETFVRSHGRTVRA
jgi:hypothetical protein